MVVVVTYIKLKGISRLFRFFSLTSKVVQQLQSSQGLLAYQLAGVVREFYTITAWENSEAMKQFARSGAHLEAMKRSREIADEGRTYMYEAEAIPSWPEANRLLVEQGKLFKFS
mmetsp:Transcript_25195/g.43507  ORF Transcript_25195/g.43507 Transcript_25195/m.43507 type:complete len:114 (-) Transcript_25195:529-870(-)|eukprot:CAMPEP_0196653296 /NCGR_PEP_ID=MMETSP1086-20130531/2913_1 /TAXON_ID=77921 /ORGANISM="Cyanoptyche  gloeocystis , Strain SAG4.97" /LENGTH=113 /DNA_ID=CAMNT_0041984411 /DNA_START=127 /DNA_END=468 /DNA_ORIENTATION=-